MAATRGGALMRGALRFGARVLILTGVLLLADVGVTLAWQEPVSALVAAREQARLEDELERRERQTAGEAARLPTAVPDGAGLRLLAAREEYLHSAPKLDPQRPGARGREHALRDSEARTTSSA